MIRSYFIVALRALWKNKVFSAINMLGLAIGISASLVIYLLVQYHFSFDKFEKDHDRIYRVVSDFIFSGERYYNPGVHDPMAEAVQNEVTGLDAVHPLRKWGEEARIKVNQEGKKTPTEFRHEGNIIFAGAGLLRMLDYEWLAGSARSALEEPYQTVLAASVAEKYFPGIPAAEIIGRNIIIDDTVNLTITGVVKDLDQHTDFTFKTFIAYVTLEKTSLKPQNWDSWNSTTGAQQLFVKLSPGIQPKQIEGQIAALYEKYHVPEEGDNSTADHPLQPLSDLHFNGNYSTFGVPLANKPTLYSLLAVAAFLLILGCINFINLSTALASRRAREIGIRKTIGGSRRQLIFQFLSETLALTFLATVLSVLLTPVILRAFSGFIPTDLHFRITSQPGILLFLASLMVIVTLLAGFYPARVLAGYRPVLVLKNQSALATGKTRTYWLRKSLTVSQFVIAQVFIMATILVAKQIQYSLQKDLGFKKDAILFIETSFSDTVPGNKYALLNRLEAMPEVAMTSLSTQPPSTYNIWTSGFKYKDGKKEVETDVQQKFADSNYINLYQIRLLAGKNIANTDTVTSVLINQTYAKLLGFRSPEEALGKILECDGRQVPISGVMADFHQKSLHEPIKPLIIGSWPDMERTVNIALRPLDGSGTNWKTAIGKMETAWKEIYPREDFEYQFFDENIARYYTAEQNISGLLSWATGLAIFISCLGLLGLVIYTTSQRTREIGIRKVLGASVSQIVSLVSKEFVALVVLAFIIAVPLAWLGMHRWLENFAYRTTISWWIFLASGLAMILIALVTLGFQAIRAALANPVRSLRTE